MCKLYAIVSPSLIKNPIGHIARVRAGLVLGQRDGFGVVTESGYIRSGNSDVALRPVPKGLLPDDWTADDHAKRRGSIAGKTTWMLAHARTSTNTLGTRCAHPFVGKKCILAHNGVVDEIGNPVSDHPNDSARLHQWIQQGGDMAKAAEFWCGYGVVMVIRDNRLHVWRDSASLYWGLHEDGTRQFATAKSDLIAPTWTGEVKDRVYFSVGLDGSGLTSEKWTGFGGRGQMQSKYFSTTNAEQSHSKSFFGYAQTKPGVWTKADEKWANEGM